MKNWVSTISGGRHNKGELRITCLLRREPPNEIPSCLRNRICADPFPG